MSIFQQISIDEWAGLGLTGAKTLKTVFLQLGQIYIDKDVGHLLLSLLFILFFGIHHRYFIVHIENILIFQVCWKPLNFTTTDT